MNHTNFLLLICVSCGFLPTLLGEPRIGINWGRLAAQRMIPSMVVDLLLQNNITDVRIFSPSKNVLDAFADSNISLSITVPEATFKYFTSDQAMDWWISEKVIKLQKANLTLRYFFTGVIPLSRTILNSRKVPPNVTVSVLDFLQRAFVRNNVTGVRAAMSNYIDILELGSKPSEAEFKADLRELMIQACTTQRFGNAPIGIEIHPILNVQEHFQDLEFAFFENNSTAKFTDGNLTYHNYFEVMHDSMVWALEKIGFPDIPILVTTGWPSDGFKEANVQNAERYLQGLTKFIMSSKGTPKCPGRSIDIQIHSLSDENAASDAPGNFTRHMGLYNFDGQPKYKLDFQGKERPILPVSAVGITHMPRRWCVLDTTKINTSELAYEKVYKYYEPTCTKADCSATAPGGSCSALPFPLNYSYWFNMGFQTGSQKVQTFCDYGGYGVVVADEPRYGDCAFPVQIIAAETTNYLGQRTSPASALRPPPSLAAILRLFLFIFLSFTCWL